MSQKSNDMWCLLNSTFRESEALAAENECLNANDMLWYVTMNAIHQKLGVNICTDRVATGPTPNFLVLQSSAILLQFSSACLAPSVLDARWITSAAGDAAWDTFRWLKDIQSEAKSSLIALCLSSYVTIIMPITRWRLLIPPSIRSLV